MGLEMYTRHCIIDFFLFLSYFILNEELPREVSQVDCFTNIKINL